MERKKLFTVIVPVYNGERYLPECLASVEQQTCTEYELLIVDDGSSDTSGAIADAYEATHQNVRVLHGANEGLLLARRKGLSHCKGEYVVFLDADDALRFDALETVLRTIEATRADIISFAFSQRADFRCADDPTRLSAGLYKSTSYHKVKTAVCRASMNPLWGKAIRLCRIDLDVSYDAYAGLMLGEDLLQLLPIIEASESLCRIDDVLYYYRINITSGTHIYKSSYLLETEIVAKRLLEYGKKWDLQQDALYGALRLYISDVQQLVGNADKLTLKKELNLTNHSLLSLDPAIVTAVNFLRFDRKALMLAVMRNKAFATCLVASARNHARKIRYCIQQLSVNFRK